MIFYEKEPLDLKIERLKANQHHFTTNQQKAERQKKRTVPGSDMIPLKSMSLS